MKWVLQIVSMVMILTVSAWESATATEEKKQRILVGDVPPAVQTTFKQQAAGLAKIIRVEKGTKGGKTVYDAIMSENGKETRIEVGEDGNFLSSHREQTFSARDIRPSPASSRPIPPPIEARRPAVTARSTPLSHSNSADGSGSGLRQDTQIPGAAAANNHDTGTENSSSESDAKLAESKKHHHRRRHLRLPFF